MHIEIEHENAGDGALRQQRRRRHGDVVQHAIPRGAGPRRMVRAALVMEIIASGIFVLGLLVEWPQPLYFPACFLWLTSVFFMVGLTIGNLNAIALEPMGHVAGTAASVIGAISTVGSVVLAIPVALSFDGTPLPLAVSILAFSVIGYGIMLMLGARGEDEIEIA